MGANLLDNKNDDHGDDDDDDDGARNPFDEILRDPDLYRALVLVMALDREPKGNTDANNTSTEPPQTVIKEGFYWKDFPSLERLLFDSMEQYYKLSTNKRQSKQQQAFNNALVESIRSTAIDSGYSFDNYFESDDKRLRDRIRCFFKVRKTKRIARLCVLFRGLYNDYRIHTINPNASILFIHHTVILHRHTCKMQKRDL